ncbi:MAG: MOSC domain-containing protein [Vicinamibacterales bacterium]
MSRHVVESRLPFEDVTFTGDEPNPGRDDSPAGTVESIWIKRAKRGPMDPVAVALLETGLGLKGNANRGGRRQVTIISAERWQTICDAVGTPVPATTRRANLMVSGIDLEHSRGRILRLGPARLRINGETRPCWQMEEARPGLLAAMSPHWGGGVFAEVLDGGEIRVGDAIEWMARE